MIILGIDTSCDDTSIAVLENDRVLSNVVSSQDEIHRDWGGVVPNLAKRAHQENFPKVYQLALKRALIDETQLEAIAVTRGPGLAIALEVGLAQAQELSTRLHVPLYAVNHMEGHLFSSLALSKNNFGTSWKSLRFPALGLLVSGGHTEIVLIRAFGEYEVIGQTVDDAMGEAFDKVARMLGLGYPGGSLLSRLAKQGDPSRFSLPIPMRLSGDLNVSYSGLKTAVRNLIHELTKGQPENLTKQDILDIAAAFEKAAITTILWKMEKALQAHPVADILLGGGVAANTQLRSQLRNIAKKHGTKLHVPKSKKLNSDNGAMIALAGYLGVQHGLQPSNEADLDRLPSLSL